MAKRESCPSACSVLRERRAIDASPSWSVVRYPGYRIPMGRARQRTFPNGKRRDGRIPSGGVFSYVVPGIRILTVGI